MQKEHKDFSIITIRDDEFEAVDQRFELTPYRGPSGRTHNIGEIQTQDGQKRTVTLTSCGDSGPQVAQQVAIDIINDFSPSLLLVVGIAGGVPDTDFTLGDVIVAARIHDFGVSAYKPGKIEWDARGGAHPDVSEIVANISTTYARWLKGWNTAQSINRERPTFNIPRFKNFDLTHMTDEDKRQIFDGEPPESWQQKILDALQWHFDDPPQRSPEPIYKTGSIAASGSLVRDTAVLIQWLQDARGIRAVEMESGGVFQAGQQLRQQQYPMIAIRGISDIVGLKRDYRWTTYACQTAAAFTQALLTKNSTIFDNLIRQPGVISPSQPPNASQPKGGDPSSQTSTPQKTSDNKETAIPVYISYAKKDETYKDELETHLALLKRDKVISIWYNDQVDLGTYKDPQIERHFNEAEIILFLVSANFMASTYYEEEMIRALNRLDTDKNVRIIPILVRPSEWQKAPIAKLQVLPRAGKPISSWSNQDQAWYEVANDIRRVCEDLRMKK